MATEFKLPELGENIHEGDVVRVLVAPGDTIQVDQPVLEVETNKAIFEVPSTVSGVIKSINVKEGDKVPVGATVLTVEDVTAKDPGAKPSAERVKAEPTPTIAEEAESREDVEPHYEDERTTVPPPNGAEQQPRQPQAPAATAPSSGTPAYAATLNAVSGATQQNLAPAAPSTRRVARELGVDINKVPGTGPGGRISVEDVELFVARQRGEPAAAPASIVPAAAAPAPMAASVVAEPLPDFSKYGAVERKPMSNVRRITATHLSMAWATIPHVTQYDKADITELDELRKRYAPRAEKAGGKLTITAILLKVVVGALRAYPQFNASVDMEHNEIIYKQYYNIGVAVDTERGLLVPVIRDVDKKGIIELSVELGQIAEKARSKKISPDDLQGATFSITNLGGIGGTYFAPIVNAPEVAILGVSRSSTEPVYKDGQFVPRMMLPLSLSYDHRLIDGADGIRFMRWIIEALQEPFLVALG